MHKQQGFTLIELMIVVAIIAILSAIGLPMYQNHVASAKVAAALADLSSHKTQFELEVSAGRTPSVTSVGFQADSSGSCSKIDVGSTGMICTINSPGKLGAGAQITLAYTDNATDTTAGSGGVITKAGGFRCTTTVLEAFVPAGCTKQAEKEAT